MGSKNNIAVFGGKVKHLPGLESDCYVGGCRHKRLHSAEATHHCTNIGMFIWPCVRLVGSV